MATRVFELARELGVKSKEIIERCKAEGVPGIDNHMTTVSAGLSESIREWFGENGEAEEAAPSTAVTTMEAPAPSTAKPKPARKAVARKKAVKKSQESRSRDRGSDRRRTHPGELRTTTTRKPATRKPVTRSTALDEDERAAERQEVKKSRPDRETEKRAETPPQIEDESFTATAPSVEMGSDEAPTVDEEPRLGEAAASAESSTIDAGAGEQTEALDEMQPTARREEPESGEPKSTPNVPQRPDIVTPAGPQLETQTPAKLSGPKVVRIEQADNVDKPRSRPRSTGPTTGGRGAMPTVGPDDEGGSGVSRRNTRRKSRGGGGGPTANRGRSGQSGRFADSGGQTGRIRDWNQQDLIEREERLKGAHGFIRTLRRESSKREAGPGERARTARETGGSVKIQEPFTIKDLSAATGVKSGEILMALMKKGIVTTVNSGIERELAEEIMLDYNIELEVEEMKSAEDLVAEQFKNREMVDERPRSPVVTILGHVDHGKTSLLDQIRKTHVAEGEAGGITQHTSAFRVGVHAGDEDKQIVFLDTPGHEAFTAMRARGAQVTDIVVLVVAADDGVMPQTIESINHAKAAEVPIIVALNKMDKPEATDANLQRIYGQLAEHDLAPPDWGGKTDIVKCSAVKAQGIQDLLDTIDVQAQVMELTADYGGPATGSVLEAKMIEGRGAVANILVREGTVHVGDFIVVGRAFGRVRDITDDRGERLQEAGPSTPIEISGLDRLPDAGDSFYIVETLKTAQQSAEQRVDFEREKALAAPKITLDNIFTTIDERERHDLNLVVKADTQGSVETLKKTLEDISTDEINIRVLHAAVGGITESDVLLAEASSAIILGFHVIASSTARNLAEQKQIEIRNYQVIYELLDDVKKAAAGLLEPELREEVLGHAEVREVFRVSKVGMIAGCYVTDGNVQRAAKIRVTRNDIVIENNRVLEQLKRFKDDVKEVRAGQECGMKIEGYDDIKAGDILECYKVVEVARKL